MTEAKLTQIPILTRNAKSQELVSPWLFITYLMGRGGLEPPTHGFSVRCSKNTSPDKTKTYNTPQTPLTPQLTPNSRKQNIIDTSELPADLFKLIAVWPNLPEHIKAAIKALLHTHIKGDQK